ncbi:hypothetical protein F8S13_07680 [Chloroflexia bacterium SDU3-3]|nr:hypothetical protein F8S13_07680 [Chloroflexia bacterium SDU3-3]
MSEERHEQQRQQGEQQGGQDALREAPRSCEVGSPDFIHERRMFRSFQHDHGQRGDHCEQPVRERAVGER